MKNRQFFSVLFCFTPFFVFAQNSWLDTTFGTRGLTVLDQGKAAPARSTMVTVAPDGDLLVGGFSLTGLSEPFTLARFQPDGTLNPTFGEAGVTQHAKFENAQKIRVLPNGKILLLLQRGFGLARLNANGSEDHSFQSAKVPSDENRNTYNTDFVVQADGKILVTAFSLDTPFDDYALARFLENGDLDKDFGKNGLASFPSNWAGLSESIALQTDGKILVTGSTGYTKISVVRYLLDGKPDPAFGVNGLAIGTTEIGRRVFGRRILVQPDGKMLIAANVESDPQGYVALYRMTATGLPDSTFGSNGNTTDKNLTKIYGFCLQSDGSLLLGGIKEGYTARTALLRFLANGQPDNSYTGTTSLGSWEVSNAGEQMGFTLQSDGKILVAIPTRSTVSATAGFIGVRLLQSGAKDPSFSGDGIAYANYDAGDDRATGIAVQPDGKIVVIGDSHSNFLDVRTVLARYKPDGKLDESFATNGKRFFSILAPNSNYAYAVALQPDGKILAAIGHDYRPIELKVVRFLNNGALDASFGVNGIAPVPGGFIEVSGIKAQADGKILVVGTLKDNSFTLVRFEENGVLDNAFGNAGVATVAVGEYGRTSGFALLSDGKIVVGGGLPFVGAAIALRFRPNGQLDPSFGSNGKARLVLSNEDFYSSSFALQGDGKILIGGAVSTPTYKLKSIIVRLNAEGTALDADFGERGVATLGRDVESSYCHAIAVLPNGKILGMGQANSTTKSDILFFNLLSNGRLDANGLVTADLGYGFADFTEIALQADGKIIATGAVRQATDLDLGILRYLTGIPVGVSEQTNPKMAIMASPNPFVNSLQLDFSALPTTVRTMAIFDLTGREVFHSATEKKRIQGLDNWTSGVYLLQVMTDKEVFIQKLVKQ